MLAVAQTQVRKLGTHPLSRDGIDLAGGLAETARPMACWNFALTGTLVDANDPLSANVILNGNGDHNNPGAILEIRPGEMFCRGLTPNAVLANHPGCGPELLTLANHFEDATNNEHVSQVHFVTALLRILAIKNGLDPDGPDDSCQLHMASSNWYTWDHFALSFRALQPGRPRIFVQTVTGEALSHACNTIWDEHLPFQVVVNLAALQPEQIQLINQVAAYGNLCVICGTEHGYFNSRINMWHRCAVCNAVYCGACGGRLGGKLGWRDYTRRCNQGACAGRTQLINHP